MQKYLTIFENGEWLIENDAPVEKLQGVVLMRCCIQTQSEKLYSELELYSEDGDLVDSCFVSGKMENMAVQTGYRIRGGKKFITLQMIDIDEKTFTISNVAFEEPKETLFNGEILYQLAPAYAQSMGYVFITKSKQVIVFDGGHIKDAENLTNIIRQYGGVVHHWFITHYHNDHIGAIIEIFEKNLVKVEKLYYDFPAVELLADRGDGDNPLVEQFLLIIPKDTKVYKAVKGLEVYIGGVTVRALNNACFDKGSNFVNDSSVCFKLETDKSKVLFTGDLGAKGDDYLLDDQFVAQIKDCNVVQMSHHGQNGLSKRFYQNIDIEVCLYPTPGWLWNNNNGGGKNSSGWTTLKTREWMREKKVRQNYTSIKGTVIIY